MDCLDVLPRILKLSPRAGAAAARKVRREPTGLCSQKPDGLGDMSKQAGLIEHRAEIFSVGRASVGQDIEALSIQVDDKLCIRFEFALMLIP